MSPRCLPLRSKPGFRRQTNRSRSNDRLRDSDNCDMKHFVNPAFISTACTAVTLLIAGSQSLFAANEGPTEWVEPETGHRVIQLSTEPGSASFYFHQNGYTASGDKLVFATPDGLS